MKNVGGEALARRRRLGELTKNANDCMKEECTISSRMH